MIFQFALYHESIDLYLRAFLLLMLLTGQNCVPYLAVRDSDDKQGRPLPICCPGQDFTWCHENVLVIEFKLEIMQHSLLLLYSRSRRCHSPALVQSWFICVVKKLLI